MDDPEGNLAIVERVGHESQRHVPYWEHSWAGTAHILNSTQHGTEQHPTRDHTHTPLPTNKPKERKQYET